MSPATRHPIDVATALACAAVVFILEFLISSRLAARWRVGMLLVQGLAIYLPVAVLGIGWAAIAGFLAGSILVLVPGRTAWGLFTVVIASVVLLLLAQKLGNHSATLTSVSLIAGSAVFGLSRADRIYRRALPAKGESAQLAAIQERERISRDLHDLLGYSLTAITLKSEFIMHTVASDPAGARDELAAVADLARQAAADVRQVASGYRNLSLPREVAAACSLLSVAGIKAKLDIECGPLESTTETVLATVLREAITNVLRHSTARYCAITATNEARDITLAVVNDGARRVTEAGQRQAAAGDHGHGLANLAWRLRTLGGELTAAEREDGQFSLLARVPRAQPPPNGHAVVRDPEAPGGSAGPSAAADASRS
jgi:two-component system, NarL family, sensor histidine kinase DesK